ncbi:MAG: NAD(P)/FAD-dependent oxidoreductase [Candidatus Nanohalobium sp.]
MVAGEEASDKVVVVGGGIAGFETVLRLERGLDAEIVLVEPREALNFYPGLHKIVKGSEVDDALIDYSEKFEGRNVKHLKEEMRGLDAENNVLELESSSISYDKLVLAFGVETDFYMTEEEFSYSFRSVEDVKEIRDRLESGIESAVVVGGGATGVEAAASLNTFRKKKEFSFDITVVQSDDRLLPFNEKRTSRKIENILLEKGINVEKNVRAEVVKQEAVKCSNGEIYDSDLTVWAAGVRKNDLVEEITVPANERGIIVDKGMKVKDMDDIYAVGDVVDYEGKENRAYFAISEAKTAAKNIKADLKGGEEVENSFIWDPQAIYLGGKTSALELPGITVTGFLPHLVQEYFIDKRYMLSRKHLL